MSNAKSAFGVMFGGSMGCIFAVACIALLAFLVGISVLVYLARISNGA